MTSLTLLAISVLADDTPRNTGPDFGKASPVGLLVIVLLLIGTFLLVFSMNRHLKKLPKTFDIDAGAAQTNGDPDAVVEPEDRPQGG